jgi:cytochrome c oxidase subunit 2
MKQYLLVLLVLLVACTSTPTGQPTGVTKEFTMTAKQFSFDPAVITVQRGDHVKLTITSVDVTHGISIPAFHVNAKLEPGKSTTVEFDATEVGMFQFRCSVVCGSGHSEMLGAVEVKTP